MDDINLEICTKLSVLHESDGAGAVLYRDGEYAYVKVDAIAPPELRDHMCEMMDSDPSHFYGMIEQDRNVHVFKIPKPHFG